MKARKQISAGVAAERIRAARLNTAREADEAHSAILAKLPAREAAIRALVYPGELPYLETMLRAAEELDAKLKDGIIDEPADTEVDASVPVRDTERPTEDTEHVQTTVFPADASGRKGKR